MKYSYVSQRSLRSQAADTALRSAGLIDQGAIMRDVTESEMSVRHIFLIHLPPQTFRHIQHK